MNRRKRKLSKCGFYCIFLLFGIMPFTALYSQGYISGRITDAENGEPIPVVTVFFTNTTVGATTDLEGNYRIRIPGYGSYSLTVSHVGYQSVIKDIEPSMTSLVFDVALQIQELEEVGISARVRFRRSDINLFWRTILGKDPSRRTIQATNPEAVYYYYNPETRILKVTCREPLQIVNYETGYHIQYILDHFTHDYNTGLSDWGSQSVFTELQPANERQKNNWAAKREEVYNVSLAKFVKSLYNNSLHNDGFVLADFSLNPDPLNPIRLSVLTQEDILSTVMADNSKTLDLSDRQVLLFSYGRSVTKDDLEMLARSQQSSGWFKSVVEYVRERQEQRKNYYGNSINVGRRNSEYERRIIASPNPEADARNDFIFTASKNPLLEDGIQLDELGLYRNLLQGTSIRIFHDGTYANKLQMTPLNSSKTLLGLSMSVPIDFNPEASISSMTASHAMLDEHLSTNHFDGIERRINEQLNIFPQEKIHLHTDRDMYIPGEKIWFKAYVTDANTHRHATNSWYVYAELISPTDSLVNRVMITQTDDGTFHGYLPVSAIVPEGDYTLRAYTRYMENLGDDYFFKKNIRIGNINGGNRESGGSRENPKNPGLDYDVTFFPEGGNLPKGVTCKVAFKALSLNGYPESVSGYIIDETGIEITSVHTYHAGMGVFAYLPEAGKKYLLKCTNETGLEKLFELPPPNSHAYSLAVSLQENSIRIDVQRSDRSPDIPCYLLVHCRGTVLYFSEWDSDEGGIDFDLDEFSAGVIQCVLFDGQMNPLSERLIFSKNDASTPVDFHTDRDAYQIRDKIVATIELPFSSSLMERAGEGLSFSHFSIAVTDDRDIAIDESVTILSSLLLSSELRGY